MDRNKLFLLALLLFQNTFLALSIKASKKAETEYIASTVVFLNEIVKLIFCLIAYLWETTEKLSTEEDDNKIHQSSAGKIATFFNLMFKSHNLLYVIPCLIYAIQNNIVFIALSMIDAALYQVLANLKIITTGLFSVFILSKSLHRLQWMSLILLATGEALAETSARNNSTGEDSEIRNRNALFGALLMLVFAMLSGFAGVFMEKMFKQKNTQVTFWMRSMMLYFWGAVVNGIIVIVQDGSKVVENGFFYGYSTLTWIVLFLLAFGGMLVSLVITKFDNITKVYVTCLSIFTTSMFSYFIFEFSYNMNFILSAIVVCVSILIYNDPVAQAQL